MLMMNVRIVRMAVHERHVRMRVRVRLLPVPEEGVRVLMMQVVCVTVRMHLPRVLVHVLMPLGQV